MTNWEHKHIIDLSSFSIEDYSTVLKLANKFKALPKTGSRKLPALQGRLISTLFFYDKNLIYTLFFIINLLQLSTNIR